MPRRRRSRLLLAVLATIVPATLALAGCSTGATDSSSSKPKAVTQVDPDAFPVTIEHAYGETTIKEEPKRVATLGWSDQDMALSLGVVPVGAAAITWGGNETSDALLRRGARGARRRPAGPLLRRRRRPDRGDRQDLPGPDPGHELRHHRAGVQEALQVRPGRRLPRRPVGHDLAGLARDGRRGARAHRRGRRGPARRPRSRCRRRGGAPADRRQVLHLRRAVHRRHLEDRLLHAEDNRPRLLTDLGMVNAPIDREAQQARRLLRHGLGGAREPT